MKVAFDVVSVWPWYQLRIRELSSPFCRLERRNPVAEFNVLFACRFRGSRRGLHSISIFLLPSPPCSNDLLPVSFKWPERCAAAGVSDTTALQHNNRMQRIVIEIGRSGCFYFSSFHLLSTMNEIGRPLI